MRARAWLLAGSAIALAGASTTASAHGDAEAEGHVRGEIQCSEGHADEFPCQRIDLIAHFTPEQIGGSELSDIWGWTDSDDGREYALVGRFDGTSFVDLGEPADAAFIGELPAHADGTVVCAAKGAAKHCDDSAGSTWRDIKVYADHAYIVSEAAGHGLQVFDLTRLRAVQDAPATFSETAHYDGFGSAHNISINEESGFAYVVGSTTYAGGPHFIDLRNPASPVAAGGYGGDGYTHDAQCVVYRGPDTKHVGRELCFNSNEDTLTIIDVESKSAVRLLSRTGYADAAYVHQGWLTDDHRYFLQNDERDERNSGGRTRTLVWDVSDVDAPRLATTYEGLSGAIDHNNYVLGRYAYQSNYTSGLRVLDVSAPESPIEVAYFDSFIAHDNANFDGTWSNYPYFASGIVVLSDISNGLFVLAPRFTDPRLAASDLAVTLTDAGQSGDDAALRLSYAVTVTNRGGARIEDVAVTHLLPDGTNVARVDSARGRCEAGTMTVNCGIGALEAGESASMSIALSADSTGSKSLEVRATALNPDQDTRDNKAIATVALRGAPAPVAAAPAPPATAAAASSSGGGGGGAALWLALACGLVRRRHRPRFPG